MEHTEIFEQKKIIKKVQKNFSISKIYRKFTSKKIET
jgi:hypothetical protein